MGIFPKNNERQLEGNNQNNHCIDKKGCINGAEILGWKKFEFVQNLQKIYIKWNIVQKYFRLRSKNTDEDQHDCLRNKRKSKEILRTIRKITDDVIRTEIRLQNRTEDILGSTYTKERASALNDLNINRNRNELET